MGGRRLTDVLRLEIFNANERHLHPFKGVCRQIIAQPVPVVPPGGFEVHIGCLPVAGNGPRPPSEQVKHVPLPDQRRGPRGRQVFLSPVPGRTHLRRLSGAAPLRGLPPATILRPSRALLSGLGVSFIQGSRNLLHSTANVAALRQQAFQPAQHGPAANTCPGGIGMSSCLLTIYTRSLSRQQTPAPEGQADSGRGLRASRLPPVGG